MTAAPRAKPRARASATPAARATRRRDGCARIDRARARPRSARLDQRLLELEPRRPDVRKPRAGGLLEAPPQHTTQGRRRRRRQRAPVGLVLEHRRKHERRVVALEHPLAGQRLEQADAEGPDVGAPVDGLSLRLLRRHVGGRAHDLAALSGRQRERRGVRQRHVPDRRLFSHRLGQAEVEDLHAQRRAGVRARRSRPPA